jgi:hypothetical protein
MNEHVLDHFRAIHDSMQSSPCDWQWIGPHMSQRMFGITEQRAVNYANRFGGQASRMQKETP